MKARLIIVCVIVAAALAGCPHNLYELTMTPQGPELARTLHVTREGGEAESVSADELNLLAKVYPASRPAESGGRIFSGNFAGRMPVDVGGRGDYKQWPTRMGTAGAYVERFRGDADPAGTVAARLQAADKLVDLLIGWFQSQMASDQRFGKLRRFMDEDFRRDVKNAGAILWAHSLTDKTPLEEGIVRVVQYGLEKGYFQADDVPVVVRATSAGVDSEESVKAILGLLRRLAAEKMGVGADEPTPAGLAFLTDGDTAKASLEAYLSARPEYRRQLEQWEREKAENPDAAKPEPGEEVGELCGVAFDLEGDGGGTDDELYAALSLAVEPFFTNGDWEDEAGAIGWSSAILPPRSQEKSIRLPILCYALWSVPDRAFQEKHFGKVVLERHELFEYCLWRAALTADEGTEWDAFVDILVPGKDLPQRLEAFRFRDEPPPPPATTEPAVPEPGRAGHVISGILDGLKAPEPTTQTQPAP